MELTYDQLNHSSTHIRLLRVLPATATKGKPWHSCIDIRCELFTTPLESAPDFEALSYEWGPQTAKDRVSITVNNQTVLGRTNAVHALAALRADEPRIVWIDVLCINQDNAKEKNHQVNLMGDIYRRATRVLVWLGRSQLESGSSVSDALKLVKVLGDEAPYSYLPPPPPTQHTNGDAELCDWVKAIIRQDISDKAASRSKSAKKHLLALHFVGTDRVFPNDHPVRESYALLVRERRDWVRRRWRLWKTHRAECRQHHYLRQSFLGRFKELKMPGHDDFVRGKIKDIQILRALQAQQQQELLVLEAKSSASNLQLDAYRASALLVLRDEQLKAVASLWYDQKTQILKLSEVKVPSQVSKEELKLEEWLDSNHHVNPEAISMEDAMKQVLEGMGRLQRVVPVLDEALSNCHRLGEEASEVGPGFTQKIFKLKKRHLAQLRLEEENQRRQLSTLRLKLRSWQIAEDDQDEELRQLAETEDQQLAQYISRWDGAHERAFRYGDGSRQDIEAVHFDEMADYVEVHLQRLQYLHHSHSLRCSEAVLPGLRQTPLLSEAGIQILHAANSCRRKAHLLGLKLRHTTLKLTLLELLSNQYHKWKLGLYDHARNLPTAAEDSRRTATEWTSLRLELARHWNEWRQAEAEQWIRTLICLASTSVPNEGLAAPLLGLESVCRLSYWRRLWIVQEVLLAKEAVLYFGDEDRTMCDWKLLTMARENLDKIPDSWQIDSAIASRLESIRASLPFLLDGLRARRKEWSLLHLLKTTENSLCKDPRDKIYGLLGIANDVHGRPIEINYSKAKTIGEVYHDVIQWHQGLYRSQGGCDSLVKFSQAVQASFKGHSNPSDPKKSPSIAVQAPSALLQQGFQCKGSLHGSIMVIEPLLEDHMLLQLRGRDRICVMLDYLNTTNNYQSRVALEQELLHLDSIISDFSVQGTSLVHSCDYSAPKHVVQDQVLAISGAKRKRNEAHFFMSGQGAFGVASSTIRDDDVLCQFNDTDVAVILRCINNQYTVVSKAILSSSRTPALPMIAPSVNVVFGKAALQGLTVPFEFSKKHKDREPLCIQESSFGWHDFITHGITAPVAPNSICRRGLAVTSVPNNKRSSASPSPPVNASVWGFIWLWHMLRQPGKQSPLLSRAAVFMNRGKTPMMLTAD
ncbi:hypothetical protein EDB81DRAFT_814091 [Dactylonectria macrodidyma]|uniref:Heterokaryon incompatibility domain-containing protein n=1 Tax=Dactylonectria macrodidyma TaxID=307937 RepID=A0A9P9DLU9_9HYPO|nr:hypothetical protein EDB81DRAFT_814091 [Dactylonectria macrodidyma]